MIFLILSVAAYVVVSYLVAQTLSNQVSALKRKLDSLSEDVTDLDDDLMSVRKRVRGAETKLASHDEMIALAHAKFDRLTDNNASVGPQRATPIPSIQAQVARAERGLKDAITSP